MPKDKLHAYYDDLAPSPALTERLKALEHAPRKQKRASLRVALPIAAAAALALAGTWLHPSPSDVVAPSERATPAPGVVAGTSEPAGSASDASASAEPTEAPSQPGASDPSRTVQEYPAAAPSDSAAPETDTSAPGSLPPEGSGQMPDTGSSTMPLLPEGACPVAGSYTRADGRDLITLWSVDCPGDAATLDVTDQIQNGSYSAVLEHGGAAVTVRLTLYPDGSYTLTVT